MPKTYEDYKREMRRNREEIALTGSNITHWRNLEKLIGKEKASLRREMAIAQQGTNQCASNEGNTETADNRNKEE